MSPAVRAFWHAACAMAIIGLFIYIFYLLVWCSDEPWFWPMLGLSTFVFIFVTKYREEKQIEMAKTISEKV